MEPEPSQHVDGKPPNSCEQRSPEVFLSFPFSCETSCVSFSGESSNSGAKNEHRNCPKIRHLVLSGGGGTGIAYYGALRESHKDGFWNINDIQSIHGVSCGAIFAFLMSMIKHIDWDAYDDYCIKRPWETVFGFSPDRLLKAYTNVGICGRETVELVVAPVLRSVDLSLNVTLREFYEFTGIETHYYTTNLNTYTLVDLSYKTHPEWTVVDCIYSSCALPLLFRPNRVGGEVYVDGGFLCNYPLQQCIDQVENPDEIFGMNKIHAPDVSDEPKIEYENITNYLLDIIAKTVDKLILKPPSSKYTMEFVDTVTSVWEVYEALKTKESRAKKINQGAVEWQKYKKVIGFADLVEGSDGRK